MRETSSYLKLNFATLCHQENGSFDALNECQFYLLSQNNRTFKKYCTWSNFMLINVNENFSVGPLIQLQINL